MLEIYGNQRYVDYKPTDIQCMGCIGSAILPTPPNLAKMTPSSEVVAIWSWEPDTIHCIATDTQNYSIVNARDPDLAPKFLAHIVDNGTRVVGYIIERIPDAREAGPEDSEKSRATPRRLHTVGLAHDLGSPIRHEFLLRTDGAILFQGFGGLRQTTDRETMDHDLEDLEDILSWSPSAFERWTGPEDVKYQAILDESKDHDRFLHPFVRHQLRAGGYKTVAAEQHKEMVAELAAKDYEWTIHDIRNWRQRFRALEKASDAGTAKEEPSS
ncbi:hypothetical protein RRF57_003691 [Xylaria bambusicola]|uniref:Uncharacterized protein n=1 Tax=Xylaria bambusicola TaxID=326684 RepID=A0AAN7UKM3_9PEZI